MRYNPQKIEKKWQKEWEKKKAFVAADSSKKPKWYSLVEFPYPSGAGMHVGHVRSYTALDALSRKRRMQGYNVLFPMGWDAFGLPTENYAIKTGISPQKATKQNTDNFRKQLKSLGLSFDWSREVDTTNPEYYKWTQWIFQQFFKAGLAYKTKMAINWCPKDKIGLANEEVVGGKCERCGTAVEQRQKEQWMLKITDYADKLLAGLSDVDYLPEIRAQQENWIGRSEGVEIEFPIVGSQHAIKVFTTRADTIYGATFLVVAPEHPALTRALTDPSALLQNKDQVQAYLEETKKKSDLERQLGDKHASAGSAQGKTGVELKGLRVINPATKKEIPVWAADYVLAGYGTGAIMAVPSHDERDRAFAERFALPIIEHPLISVEEAIALTGGIKKVTYKLRDWVFSRQRYWGEPIPLIYCQSCADLSLRAERSNPSGQLEMDRHAAVAARDDKYNLPTTNYSLPTTHSPGWFCVPEKDLPVKLPKVDKYEPTDNGESPLSTMEKWVKVKCPQCKGPARRETDTMPNWAGSSWYFLAYLMSKKAFKGSASLRNWELEIRNFAHWQPVDWYNGGMEHVTLHLLYSRFWNQFLFDQGLVGTSEPYKKRTAHGMILAADGKKMSKSLGNVVNPDDLVKEFGADAVRLYILFIAPFNQAAAWDNRGVLGTARFLERVWRTGVAVAEREALPAGRQESSPEIARLLNRTIKKVGEDIEAMSFNTAVSSMMIFINEVTSGGADAASSPAVIASTRSNPSFNLSIEDWQKFLKILSPFAPHITEELYQLSGSTKNQKLSTKGKGLLSEEGWPEYDPALLVDANFDLIVQINSKVRGKISAARGISQVEALELVKKNPETARWITGEVKKVVFVADRLINVIL